MTHIIAITNQKGGVGKTTTAINIAACLAALDYKTLLIDADPQGNTTSGIGISKQNLKMGLYDFLMENKNLNEVTMPSNHFEKLFIIPTNSDLSNINHKLAECDEPTMIMKKKLDKEKSNFDFIIIDSPPSLELITINIMIASDKIIIPTQPEYFGLEGLADLTNTYSRIHDTYNPNLSIMGVLITMFTSANNLSKEVSQNLRENLGDLVFNTIIPRNIKLAEAPSHCKPIILYDLKSTGSIAYQNLAREILERLQVN